MHIGDFSIYIYGINSIKKMENSSRKEMIKHLSEIVIPILRQKGFKGSFPHFRRVTSERINLLTFQFDRYGGGFVIEIANCQPAGFATSWGKKIEPNKLTAHDLYRRKRIQSNMDTLNSSTEDWFRYDKRDIFGLGNIYKSVSNDVLSKLPYCENYWQNGELSG
jgi:hypothetical protein